MLAESGAVVVQELIISGGTVNYNYVSCNLLIELKQCIACDDTSYHKILRYMLLAMR